MEKKNHYGQKYIRSRIRHGEIKRITDRPGEMSRGHARNSQAVHVKQHVTGNGASRLKRCRADKLELLM